jgi:hypothetical protein
MGDVVAINWLIPGSKVLVTEDKRSLRIQTNLDDSCNTQDYRVELGPPANIVEINTRKASEREFKYTVDVPASADRPAVLVYSYMEFTDNFTKTAVGAIGKGYPYVTTLEGPIDPDNPNLEAEIQFWLVLHENNAGALLLGILSKAESRLFADSENLVAVLDVLGFSKMMAEVPLETLYRSLTGTLSQLVFMSGFIATGAMVFDERGNIQMPEELETISYGMFQDTVVLYLKKPGVYRSGSNPLEILCTAITSVVDSCMCDMGWLLRGAISVGGFKTSAGKAVFIGPSITEAHQMEQDCEWCGCVVCESVLRRFPEEVERLVGDGRLNKYGVPTKKGRSEHVAVNWAYHQLERGVDRFKRLASLAEDAPREAHQKVANTAAYLEHLRKANLVSIGRISPKLLGVDPDGWIER